MSKVRYSKFRLSRRIGKSVHGHASDAINFRNYFNGHHGQSLIRKNSEYATQLIAKQTIKYHHNITKKTGMNFIYQVKCLDIMLMVLLKKIIKK